MILSLALFGCSPASSEQVKKDITEDKQVTTMKKNEEFQENPQVPNDQSLIEVGDEFEDEKGKVTLKKIVAIDQTVEIGNIEMTIKDVKLIQLMPDYSLIDYFHSLTHEEKFVFAKLDVEIKNTSDESLNFAPVAMIETNQGEAIPWENDIYLEGLNGKIEGQERKVGNMGFIVEKADLQSLTITTSDVFTKDEKKLQDAATINVNFKE